MGHVTYLVFFILSYLSLLSLAQEERKNNSKCSSFSCGGFQNIKFPFTNQTHLECGLCVVGDCDKPTQKIQLGRDDPWYYITSINQDETVTLYDQVFEKHLNSRSCEPFKNSILPSFSPLISFEILSNLTMFKCPPSLDDVPMNFNVTCDDFTIYYNHPNDDDELPSLPPQCSLIQLPVNKTRNTTDLFHLLTGIFSLQVRTNWRARIECKDCPGRDGHCQIDNRGLFHCSGVQSYGKSKARIIIAAAASTIGIGMLIVLTFWVRKSLSYNKSMIFWKRKTDESFEKIEAFLRNHGSLAPKRYSYADVRKMTKSFKNKIGQGGYGGVYKGKLLDGRNVAIKVLNETKGNGEDFINEVASISRTSHVNIVTLLGFCFEGHRRALVYEFVSNGSLDKFIYGNSSLETDYKLKWETLYQIAVGIARGLEYLHRGCNTRILHLDIKPHNILIDEDFCPKISDFGLAKICHRKESVVSMSCARGTVGYIAPEVFCRNIGEVSHKSDVYSYGMMVFEMTGGRNNSNVAADRSSEIYFPHWVYKRLERGEELGLQGIENEEDEEYARKMIIVSLWCIQTNPSDRPAMNRVVEMLEASLESLQVPPKPLSSSSGSLPGSVTTPVSLIESSLGT